MTQESAKRLGQLLGADYLIIGSVGSVEEGRLVSLRALSVEDGTVRVGATALLRDQGAVFEDLPSAVTITNVKLWPVTFGVASTVGRPDLGYEGGFCVPITGELHNASSQNHLDLVFDVTVYDRLGHVMAVDRSSLGAIRASEIRSFRIHVYLGPYPPPAAPARMRFVRIP